MATTQLFAELLVIGVGVACWLSLLVAAALGYRFDEGIPKLDPSLLVALGGVAYVLGIVVDRLAYALLGPIERAQSNAIVAGAGYPEPQEMERDVLASSEALGRQVQYNRSRLRICRAWAINALLVSVAFVVWNVRVRVVPLRPSLVLVAAGLSVCILMAWTTRALVRDHYKNIFASYEFLTKKSKPKTGAASPGLGPTSQT
jgi:hypothetical protein